MVGKFLRDVREANWLWRFFASLIRNWQEIVAQIAAVLYLRAEGYGDYNEYLAIEDHSRILDAYAAHDLDRIKQENRRINKRVEDECILALERIQVTSGSQSD